MGPRLIIDGDERSLSKREAIRLLASWTGKSLGDLYSFQLDDGSRVLAELVPIGSDALEGLLRYALDPQETWETCGQDPALN